MKKKISEILQVSVPLKEVAEKEIDGKGRFIVKSRWFAVLFIVFVLIGSGLCHSDKASTATTEGDRY